MRCIADAARDGREHWRCALGAMVTLALLATGPAAACQQSGRLAWPRRVLVTNDNGTDDRATLALARPSGTSCATHDGANTLPPSGTGMSAVPG